MWVVDVVFFRFFKFKCLLLFIFYLLNVFIIIFFWFWDIFGFNLLRNLEKFIVLFLFMLKDRNKILRLLLFSCKLYMLVLFLSFFLVNFLEKLMFIFLKMMVRFFIFLYFWDRYLLCKILNNLLVWFVIFFF